LLFHTGGGLGGAGITVPAYSYVKQFIQHVKGGSEALGKPTHNKSGYKKPGYGRPGHSKPTYDKLNYSKLTHCKLTHCKLIHYKLTHSLYNK